MSYQSIAYASTDPTFSQQIQQAAIAQAVVVAGEGTAVTNHTLREQLSVRILTIGQTTAQWLLWAQAVMSDGVTAPGATDAAVLARIATLWDAFSGGI